MLARKRRKWDLGDVYFIAYNPEAEYENDGRSAYNSKPTDTGFIAQIIKTPNKHAVIMALYQGEYEFSDLENIEIQQAILLDKLKGIYQFTSSGIKRGWWWFVENQSVHPEMPYQVYNRTDGYIMDYEEENIKPIQGYEYIPFIRYGLSSTAGVSQEIGRAINGLDTDWEVDFAEFTPSPEATVWKIFPEAYPDPTIK